MAVPCNAPPSAALSPKTNSAASTSVWGRPGDVEGTTAGTGTDKVMSVVGAVAEDGAGSGAGAGGGAGMGGGTSSQGGSTDCPESCTLSAGGCTDSHTHTQTHANSIKDMHVSSNSC